MGQETACKRNNIIEAEGRGTQCRLGTWIDRQETAGRSASPEDRYLGGPELTDRRSHQARRRQNKSLVLRVQLSRTLARQPCNPARPPPPGPPCAQTDFRLEKSSEPPAHIAPAGIVLLCILRAVAVTWARLAYFNRQKPQASRLDLIPRRRSSRQNTTMVAVTLTNWPTAGEVVWIHTLKAQLTDIDGKPRRRSRLPVWISTAISRFPAEENSAAAAVAAAKLPPERNTEPLSLSFPAQSTPHKRKSETVTIPTVGSAAAGVLTEEAAQFTARKRDSPRFLKSQSRSFPQRALLPLRLNCFYSARLLPAATSSLRSAISFGYCQFQTLERVLIAAATLPIV